MISCTNGSIKSPKTDLLNYRVNDIRELKKAEIEIGDRVFLETSPGCLMGVPQKIIENKGILFVFCQQEKGAIFLFNKTDGRFIRKINHVGKGPGEYTRLRDFDLDKEKGILYLLDDNQRVLLYSMEDVLQSEIRLAYELPADFYNLAVRDKKILIDGMDNNANSLYQFSLDGKLEKVLAKSAHLTINQFCPFYENGL